MRKYTLLRVNKKQKQNTKPVFSFFESASRQLKSTVVFNVITSHGFCRIKYPMHYPFRNCIYSPACVTCSKTGVVCERRWFGHHSLPWSHLVTPSICPSPSDRLECTSMLIGKKRWSVNVKNHFYSNKYNAQ